MAKRKRPDPAVTVKWKRILRELTEKRDRLRSMEEEIDKQIGAAVRSAFDEGVLVGTLKEATGLSGSRLYQLKFELRDREKAQGA